MTTDPLMTKRNELEDALEVAKVRLDGIEDLMTILDHEDDLASLRANQEQATRKVERLTEQIAEVDAEITQRLKDEVAVTGY
jgi:flagellar motility protein MotE (MotC chaperone)